MDKLESVPDDDKAIATQTKLLGDLVALAKQDSAALRLNEKQRLEDATKAAKAAKRSHKK